MIADFSERFVEFVGKLEQSLPKQFVCKHMVDHGGRIAALSAEFSNSQTKKLLGIMKTSLVSHCHEYRLAYAVPSMNLDLLNDWWEYTKEMQKALVPVDAAHEFSMVSMILVCGEVDKAAARKIGGKVSELRYAAPLAGWSSVRILLVDLETGKLHANRMGAPLRDLVKPVLSHF